MSVSESRFNMWRSVIAMIHADEIVQPHEVNFIMKHIRPLMLSDEQEAILVEDIRTPADIEHCFEKITSAKDREDFFHFAKSIAWSDGDFDVREEAFLNKIRALPSVRQEPGVVERVLHNFKDIHIEGHDHSDQTFMSIIKGLLGPKPENAV